MNLNLKKLVLGSAGLGIAVIGLIYLLAPHLLLDVYGVDIHSPSEANLFRSGSGSLFVALAILFFLGAANTRYTRTSLVTLFTFPWVTWAYVGDTDVLGQRCADRRTEAAVGASVRL